MPRFSIRTKLLSGVVATLAPVLLLLLTTFGVERASARAEVLDRLQRSAEGGALVVDETLERALAVGWALATDPALEPLAPAAARRRFEALAPYASEYLDISLFDARGRELASVPRAPARARAVPVPLEEVLRTNRPVLTWTTLADQGREQPVIVIAVPVRGTGERASGVVRLLVDGSLSRRIIGAAGNPGLRQDVFLIDPRGQVVFHTARPHLTPAERDASRWPDLAPALAGATFTREDFASPLLDERRAAAFASTPRHGWIVGVTSPHEEAFSPVRRLHDRQIMAFIALTLLAVAGALALAAYLSRPLRRLADHVTELGRGKLVGHVHVHTGDEIEELANAVNALVTRLETTRSALADRAEELASVSTAAKAVVQGLDLPAVGTVVVDEARALLDGEVAALWLADLPHEQLTLVAQAGFPSELTEQLRTIPMTADIAATRAARTQRLTMVEDVEKEPGFEEGRAIARRAKLRSLLSVPLSFGGRLVGVLSIGNSEPHRFDEREQHVAIALGDVFASAIEHARLYDQVREALHLREEFIGAAAHELRTPATALAGYIQLLSRQEPTDPRTRRAIARARAAAERANRLAHELSEVDELAEGQPQLHPEVTDLVEVAQDAARAAQGETDRHRFLVCVGRPVPIVIDRARVVLAVRELLENAIKYQPEGGPVHLTVGADATHGLIEIRDFGVGIPPDRLPHVFEPLFEPWPPGSAHYVGVAGLGLFLARRIAEAHGGTLHIESEIGSGSAYRLELPLPLAPVEQARWPAGVDGEASEPPAAAH